MPDLTLAEMAREIERRHATALPKGIKMIGNAIWYINPGGYSHGPVIDDLAHAILRDVMVMATRAKRHVDCWTVPVVPPEDQPWEDLRTFLDADHGNCPTRSLFAAFCHVFPEPTP